MAQVASGSERIVGSNIWDLIVRRAEATPERDLAVDQDGHRISFGAYRDRCERVAAGLAAQGVTADSVVSWQLPTWIEAMVLMGALRRLGAVQNPILPIYREREVGFVVRQARPSLLVVPSTWRGVDFEAMAGGLTRGTGTQVLTCDGLNSLPEADPAGLGPAPDEDMFDPAAPVRWLYYTSGTTADPKGVKHADAALHTASVGMSERLRLRGDDRFALVFPLTHVAGGVYLYAAMAYGVLFIVDEAFDPSTTIELLQRERVTQAGAGTYFHQVYLQAQRERPDERIFPEVRSFPGGGAPKPPQLHRDIRAAFGGAGIVSGYGLTEAPIITMNDASADSEVLALTEGPAVEGAKVRVMGDRGAEAAPGEEGELQVKGLLVTRGYVDGSLDEAAFDDGWFRSGDLGVKDAEGNITITGRLKDVIIRKGENISAKEVEDALFTHPKVADVAVVGLADDERGERACAVVVPSGEGVELSLEEVAGHLGEAGLISRKWPEQVELVDALPRNPTGKVLKFELQKRFS